MESDDERKEKNRRNALCSVPLRQCRDLSKFIRAQPRMEDQQSATQLAQFDSDDAFLRNSPNTKAGEGERKDTMIGNLERLCTSTNAQRCTAHLVTSHIMSIRDVTVTKNLL